jgi:hypothetical protein
MLELLLALARQPPGVRTSPSMPTPAQLRRRTSSGRRLRDSVRSSSLPSPNGSSLPHRQRGASGQQFSESPSHNDTGQ